MWMTNNTHEEGQGRPATANELESAVRTLSHFDLIGRTEELSALITAIVRAVDPNAAKIIPVWENPSGIGIPLSRSELEAVRISSMQDAALYRRFCRPSCPDAVGCHGQWHSRNP